MKILLLLSSVFFISTFASKSFAKEMVWVCSGHERVILADGNVAHLKARVTLDREKKNIRYERASKPIVYPYSPSNPGPEKREDHSWTYEILGSTRHPDYNEFHVWIPRKAKSPGSYYAFRFFTKEEPKDWNLETSFKMNFCFGNRDGEWCDDRYECRLK